MANSMRNKRRNNIYFISIVSLRRNKISSSIGITNGIIKT
jgi:hypothetical protein